MSTTHVTTADTKSRRKRPSRAKKPAPTGKVTVIDVPHPPASAMNKNRPITDLIKAQLSHVRHAEKGRVPKHLLSGVKPADIHTEAEAAAYIARVTRLLHPRGKKKAKKASPKVS